MFEMEWTDSSGWRFSDKNIREIIGKSITHNMASNGDFVDKKIRKSISVLWNSCKKWRTIRVGKISIIYRLTRSVPVSNNLRRRIGYFMQNMLLPAGDEHSDAGITFSVLADGAAACREIAVLIGVGPGLGFALAHKLVDSGMHVVLASREVERLDAVVAALQKLSAGTDQIIRAYSCDATNEASVKKLVSIVAADIGVPHLMAYTTQGFVPGRMADVEVCAFEESWRQNCLGAFIAAKESVRLMETLQRGTIVLIGSTSSVIGRAHHLNLAVGKFGLRALSQVMARELWPSGIHVVHLVIDADIKENELFNDYIQANPEDIADLVYKLHRQPKSAWSSEVDIRPFNEKWWEHC